MAKTDTKSSLRGSASLAEQHLPNVKLSHNCSYYWYRLLDEEGNFDNMLTISPSDDDADCMF